MEDCNSSSPFTSFSDSDKTRERVNHATLFWQKTKILKIDVFLIYLFFKIN